MTGAYTNAQALMHEAISALSAQAIDTSARDAHLLFHHVTKQPMANIIAGMPEPVTDSERKQFMHLIARRCQFEPVAYLTGRAAFWDFEVQISKGVLIPRPDTETLVEIILRRRPKIAAAKILDLGAGSGCVSFALLKEIKNAQATAIDVSIKALNNISLNAIRLGLAERMVIGQADMRTFEVKAHKFDIVVSNPPYIPSGDIPGLMPDVRDHEPWGALDGGKKGMDFYHTILDRYLESLNPEGLLAVEIGARQGADVARLFDRAGLIDVEISPDLAGQDRVVSGKLN